MVLKEGACRLARWSNLLPCNALGYFQRACTDPVMSGCGKSCPKSEQPFIEGGSNVSSEELAASPQVSVTSDPCIGVS